MAPRDFPPELGIGRDIFLQAKDDLVAAGLLHYERGWQRLHNWTNFHTGASALSSGGGMVSRFQLTPKALEMAEEAAVTRGAWEDHWERRKAVKPPSGQPGPIIFRRARKLPARGPRSPGLNLPVDFSHPKVSVFANDLEAHNAFLFERGVGGVEFLGLRRVFTDGDQPGFNWQWHGRFYSRKGGEAYELLKGAERRRRLTLGGERVGEVDIRASQLTMLYALHKMSFSAEQDPYAIEGEDRELVKQWIAQALGRNDVDATRWSEVARRDFETTRPGRKLSAAVPIAQLREKVLGAHPVLGHLGQSGEPTQKDLEFHESEVMRAAMARLRNEGVPSLPVHDSLVVPMDRLEFAATAVVEAFINHVRNTTGQVHVEPTVRLKRPGDLEP